MRIHGIVGGALLLLAATAVAQPRPRQGEKTSAMASMDPEVKKTADAFAFSGTFEATLTAPDGKVDRFPVRLTCKKVAYGQATSCDMRGTSKTMGKWEGTSLFGYDPVHKQVHFMSMSSMPGDIHDFTCQWKGEDRIDCQTLKSTNAEGKKVSQDVTFELTNGKVSKYTATANIEGTGTMTFEAVRKTR